jgi:hypothetical protein
MLWWRWLHYCHLFCQPVHTGLWRRMLIPLYWQNLLSLTGKAGFFDQLYRPRILQIQLIMATQKHCRLSFHIINTFRRAVPWLRRLVVGLPPRRPGFDPGSVHVGFVVDKVTLYFGLPLPISFHRCSITMKRTKNNNHRHLHHRVAQ